MLNGHAHKLWALYQEAIGKERWPAACMPLPAAVRLLELIRQQIPPPPEPKGKKAVHVVDTGNGPGVSALTPLPPPHVSKYVRKAAGLDSKTNLALAGHMPPMCFDQVLLAVVLMSLQSANPGASSSSPARGAGGLAGGEAAAGQLGMEQLIAHLDKWFSSIAPLPGMVVLVCVCVCVCVCACVCVCVCV